MASWFLFCLFSSMVILVLPSDWRKETMNKKHLTYDDRLVSTSKGNNCIHHCTCTRIPDLRSNCSRGKKQCQTACDRCQEGCTDYQEEFCTDYKKSPFVCNACDHRLRCRLRRMLYNAKYA